MKLMVELGQKETLINLLPINHVNYRGECHRGELVSPVGQVIESSDILSDRVSFPEKVTI